MSRHDFSPGPESHTVTLASDDLQEIVRLLQRLTTVSQQQKTRHTADRQTLIKYARQAFDDRRRRIGIFGPDMFGEPAWDILLILYIEKDWHRHTIGSLANVSMVSPSSALRWLNALQARDLITRTQHPTDLRAAFVELSEKGEQALNSYFSETHTSVR